MVNIVIENGKRKMIMDGVKIENIENRINQYKLKVLLYEHMCENIDERDWCDKKKKGTPINLKMTNNVLSYYKLEYLLFKTFFDNKDLSKLLPLLKRKFEEIFNNSLEMWQELLDNDLINEGDYLEFSNDTKTEYDCIMSTISFFQKIVDGWEWRLQAE